jgi:hypothetical protein
MEVCNMRRLVGAMSLVLVGVVLGLASGCAEGPAQPASLGTLDVTTPVPSTVYVVTAVCGQAVCPWVATTGASYDTYVTWSAAFARDRFVTDARQLAAANPEDPNLAHVGDLAYRLMYGKTFSPSPSAEITSTSATLIIGPQLVE